MILDVRVLAEGPWSRGMQIWSLMEVDIEVDIGILKHTWLVLI